MRRNNNIISVDFSRCKMWRVVFSSGFDTKVLQRGFNTKEGAAWYAAGHAAKYGGGEYIKVESYYERAENNR